MNGVCLIFFGGGNFGKIILEKLINSPFKPLILVAIPPKPAGRGLKVKNPEIFDIAEKNEIALRMPQKLGGEFIEELKKLKPDIGVIASYGKIIPKKVLDIFPNGIINIHPSLLPKYRGASPIQSAILNGDTETGTTLMLTDEELDHGPIIAQEKIGLNEDIDHFILEKHLAELGADLLIKILPEWLDKKVKPMEQNHLNATLAKIIEKKDGYLNFNEPADVIKRKMAALKFWPGSYAYIESGKIIKILGANIFPDKDLTPEETGLQPGTVFAKADKIIIRCAKDNLEALELQIEGKKPIKAPDFIRGYKQLLNKKLL